jgi:Uma2 family endonuclease
LEVKRKTYAAAEIQDYWVVDLKHRHLKVFREPVEGDYTSPITLTTGEIRPLAFPDIAVSVRRLLEGQ